MQSKYQNQITVSLSLQFCCVRWEQHKILGDEQRIWIFWGGKGVPLSVVNQEMRESCDKSAGQLNWKQTKNQTTSWGFLQLLLLPSIWRTNRWSQILQEEVCYRSKLSGPSHPIYSLVPACFFWASLNYSSCDLKACLLLYYQFEITNILFYFKKTIFRNSWGEDF